MYTCALRGPAGVSNATTRQRELLQYVHSVAIVCDRRWGVGSGPAQPGLDARPGELHARVLDRIWPAALVIAAAPQPRGSSIALMPTVPSPWRRHLSRPSGSAKGWGSMGFFVNRGWKDARAHPNTMQSGRENRSTCARICRGAWPERIPFVGAMNVRFVIAILGLYPKVRQSIVRDV